MGNNWIMEPKMAGLKFTFVITAFFECFYTLKVLYNEIEPPTVENFDADFYGIFDSFLIFL